jgi:hypothetical protein
MLNAHRTPVTTQPLLASSCVGGGPTHDGHVPLSGVARVLAHALARALARVLTTRALMLRWSDGLSRWP